MWALRQTTRQCNTQSTGVYKLIAESTVFSSYNICTVMELMYSDKASQTRGKIRHTDPRLYDTNVLVRNNNKRFEQYDIKVSMTVVELTLVHLSH